MRVIACMAIVLLHTANVAEILYREQITLTQRAVSMGIVYEMMWAVPLFLMVSGALLLPGEKAITIRTSLTRYALRILIALVAFVFLFRLFDMVMNGEAFSVQVLTDALYKLFTGTSWSHLWYLYLLIGLYLLLPFYRMITEKADAQQMRYLLLIYALFLSLLPLTRMAGVSSAFTIQTAAIYLFYFFAGYACAKKAASAFQRKCAFSFDRKHRSDCGSDPCTVPSGCGVSGNGPKQLRVTAGSFAIGQSFHAVVPGGNGGTDAGKALWRTPDHVSG